MASMTLVLLSRRKRRMKTMNVAHKAICAIRRSFSSAGRRMISTQKLVVSDVRAESALLNDEATMPMVKKTTTGKPSVPMAANIGSSSSPEDGSVEPLPAASWTRSTP